MLNIFIQICGHLETYNNGNFITGNELLSLNKSFRQKWSPNGIQNPEKVVALFRNNFDTLRCLNSNEINSDLKQEFLILLQLYDKDIFYPKSLYTNENENENENDEYTNENENEHEINSDFVDHQMFEVKYTNISTKPSCLNKIYDKIFIISVPSRKETLSITIYQLIQENIDFMVWKGHSSNNNYSMYLWQEFKQYIDNGNYPKMYENDPPMQENSAYYNKMTFFLLQTELDIIKHSQISNFQKILILEDDITISDTKWINLFCESEPYIPKWLTLRLGQNEQYPLKRRKSLRPIHGNNSSMQFYQSSSTSWGAFAISIRKPMFKPILDLFEGDNGLQLPLDAVLSRKYFTPTKPQKFFLIHPPLFLPDWTRSLLRGRVKDLQRHYEFMHTSTIDQKKTQVYFSKYWKLRFSTDISNKSIVPAINDFETLISNCPCDSYLKVSNDGPSHSHLGKRGIIKQKKKAQEMFSLTEPKLVLEIYQMLYDIDKIFTQNNISYLMEGGTLLGAVRHKGLIPWDNDADFIVFENEFNQKIQSQQFIHDLSKHGYYIIRMENNVADYKIFSTNSTTLTTTNLSMPFIDVFLMVLDGRKYTFTNYWFNENWPEVFFYKHELYPLERYVFGDVELWGPHYSYPYLDRIYGENWNESKYKTYDHIKEEYLGKHVSNIEEQDRQYAKPIGPLLKWYGNESKTYPSFISCDNSTVFNINDIIIYDIKIDIVLAWCGFANISMGQEQNYDIQRDKDNEELKYLLRSIAKNVNWVNNIYILVNNIVRKPYYVPKNITERVHMINRCNLMPKGTCPTRNSLAVYQYVHNIPNLSEYFIMAEDDIFIGRKVGMNHFFTCVNNQYLPYVWRTKGKYGYFADKQFHPIYINNKTNSLFDKLPKSTAPSPHLWYPMLKSVSSLLYNEYLEFFQFVASHNYGRWSSESNSSNDTINSQEEDYFGVSQWYLLHINKGVYKNIVTNKLRYVWWDEMWHPNMKSKYERYKSRKEELPIFLNVNDPFSNNKTKEIQQHRMFHKIMSDIFQQ